MKRIKNDVMRNPYADYNPIKAAYGYEKTAGGAVIYEQDDEGRPLRDQGGNKVPKQITRDLTTANAIRDFLATGINPQKDFTLEDSHTALRIMDVLRPFKLFDAEFVAEQPKTINIEEHEYEWLLKFMKERTPMRYGVLASVYVKAVENLEMVEVPPKAGKPEDKDLVGAASGNGQHRVIKGGKT